MATLLFMLFAGGKRFGVCPLTSTQRLICEEGAAVFRVGHTILRCYVSKSSSTCLYAVSQTPSLAYRNPTGSAPEEGAGVYV